MASNLLGLSLLKNRRHLYITIGVSSLVDYQVKVFLSSHTSALTFAILSV